MDVARIGALLAGRAPGHGLPRAFYTDPAIFDFDMAAIHARSWLLIGFEIELPRPGSYLSTLFGRWPILITRDRAGKLAAFHNTCRHRGAQICEVGRGSAARLVCPYHAWTYELSGELSHAARMGEDFDKSRFGLLPIHVESLEGAIYVCMADTPPPFDDFRAQFGPLLAPHRLGEAKVAFESTLVEKGNWKLVMENARECYHCARRHPELARTFPVGASGHFDYGEDTSLERFNARMADLGLPVGPVEGSWWQAMRFALNDGARSMTADGRPAVSRLMCETGGGDIGSLRWSGEPAGFCHATGDHLFMFSAQPLGPRKTAVVGKWLVHRDAREGVDYDIEDLARLWTVTNLQDRDLVETNQRGVDSPAFRPGPYSQEAEALAIRFVDWYCDTARAFIEAP
jgi:Rieske 2Fe-2S family protein